MNPFRWIFKFAFGCRHRHLSQESSAQAGPTGLFRRGEGRFPDTHTADAA
jgi:hypothetical protein